MNKELQETFDLSNELQDDLCTLDNLYRTLKDGIENYTYNLEDCTHLITIVEIISDKFSEFNSKYDELNSKIVKMNIKCKNIKI